MTPALPYKQAGPGRLRLSVLGDYLEMDCYTISKLRAQVDVDLESSANCKIGFLFTVTGQNNAGRFYEVDSATRFDPGGSSGQIDCTGYARVRIQVVVVATAADCYGTGYIYGYSALNPVGFESGGTSFPP